MTDLLTRKSKLVFTSADTIREAGRLREVVIEAHPLCASVRLKGLRQSYDIPWSAIWSTAVKMQIARERAEKSIKRTRR